MGIYGTLGAVQHRDFQGVILAGDHACDKLYTNSHILAQRSHTDPPGKGGIVHQLPILEQLAQF